MEKAEKRTEEKKKMTAPTHGIFAAIIIFLFNLPAKAMAYVVFGSLIPDIDHEKSFIGRIFFPLSHPINKRFGHRHITHSLLLWFPIIFLGLEFSKPLYWIGLGAMSHLFLDCWNLTGLGLFKPISDKVFVMANKKYRIKVGSRNEFILMVSFLMIGYGSYEINRMGGVRGILRDTMGDYNMVLSDYQNAGLKLGYIEGKLRSPEGKIEKVRYLIIGIGLGTGHLVLYDEKRDKIINVPEQGKFLKARYREGIGKWSTMKVKQPLTMDSVEGMAFNKASRKWRKVEAGDLVIGDILYLGKVSLR